jgi:hypothetical protein
MGKKKTNKKTGQKLTGDELVQFLGLEDKKKILPTSSKEKPLNNAPKDWSNYQKGTKVTNTLQHRQSQKGFYEHRSDINRDHFTKHHKNHWGIGNGPADCNDKWR